MEKEVTFKTCCAQYLLTLSIGDLRAYGRRVGVVRPTTKNKPQLIEEISAILAGEIQGIIPSKQGAPVKNDYVAPIIVEQIERIKAQFDVLNARETPFYDTQEYKNRFQIQAKNLQEKKFGVWQLEDPDWDDRCLSDVYRGQYEKINGVNWLIPLDTRALREAHILLLPQFVEEYNLRYGDVVSCYVRKGEKALVASKVLTVNGLCDKIERPLFDESPVCYPTEKITLCKNAEQSSATLKYLDWILPISRGQRGCIIAPPKSGKTATLYQIAEKASLLNEDICTLVLLIDQPPESIAMFNQIVSMDNFIYARYDEDPEQQIFAAEFILKRAKRFAEYGRNVLLIVDSLSAIARAYNDTDESSGGKTFVGGLESKTVQYIKRYLGSARKLENGGSLTIIGGLNSSTGNPADDILCAELSTIANFEMRLSDKLAIKRVYPALDHLHSHATSDYLDEKLDQTLREISSLKQTDDWLVRAITNASSYEEFSETVKKEKNQLRKNN